MPDLVQEKLHAILMDHGRRVMDDPPRLEALLRDYCGERRREVSALLSALREGVPASLGSAPFTVPREALIGTLARRLQENQGLAADLARWAVETWAFALHFGEPPNAAAMAPVQRTARAAPVSDRAHRISEGSPRIPRRRLAWISGASVSAAALIWLIVRAAGGPGGTPRDTTRVSTPVVDPGRMDTQVVLDATDTSAVPPKKAPNRVPDAPSTPSLSPLAQAEADCAHGRWHQCYVAGDAYHLGKGTTKNYAKALELWSRGCTGGDGYSCVALGVMYQLGQGVGVDRRRAHDFYARGCEKRHSSGCFNVANAYETGEAGWGVERNLSLAADYYAKACGLGLAQACQVLQRLRPQSPADTKGPEPLTGAADAGATTGGEAGIRKLLDELEKAIQARDLNTMQRLYPTMPGKTEMWWRRIFEDHQVRGVTAKHEVGMVTPNGANAELDVVRVLTIEQAGGAKTTRTPLKVRLALWSDGWRILQIRGAKE